MTKIICTNLLVQFFHLSLQTLILLNALIEASQGTSFRYLVTFR